MSNYIWYSPATDITGQALADAISGLTGSKTKPRSLRSGDNLIGWGTKTSEATNIANGVRVFNHPDKIRANRNKLGALKTMKANNGLANTIADFTPVSAVISSISNNSPIKLPLVGRTKFHQGGKGFWFCPTQALVQRAITDGAEYFQNFLDIKDEYRLHVAFGAVIYAVKKIENANEASWTAQRVEKIKDYAQKNNVTINDTTLDYVLKRMFKEAVLPDMIVRSNRRGWKFSGVRLNSVADALKTAAISAVNVLGLQFGAVDCAMGNDNNPYIIEVNSGPGLQGTALEKYAAVFTAKIAEAAPAAPARQHATSSRAAGGGNAQAAAAGVGAENASNNIPNAGLATVMQNVQSDDEARAVIELLMSQRNNG